MMQCIMKRTSCIFPPYKYFRRYNCDSLSNYEYFEREKLFDSGRTIPSLKEDFRVCIGVDKEYHIKRKSRRDLEKYLNLHLPERRIEDSYLVGLIPVHSDAAVRARYINSDNFIRMGRLMEDVDMFSVIVFMKHLLNPGIPKGIPYPNYIVTVYIDSLVFTGFIPKISSDIHVKGHVSYIGKTSGEVTLWMEQHCPNAGEAMEIMHGYIGIASREPSLKKSAPVNPLIASNECDRRVIQTAKKRREYQVIKKQQNALLKQVPTPEEQVQMHKIFQRTNSTLFKTDLPKDCRWMRDHCTKNVVTTYPESRNMHHSVFGGCLIRRAVESAQALLRTYTNHTGTVVGITDISFSNHIILGSVLNIQSQVVYTEKNYLQILVCIDALHKAGTYYANNYFNITFKSPESVVEVLPNTYQEYILYLEGKRQFNRTMVMLQETFVHSNVG